MRILYVADGRSPTALNWIKHVVAQGHQVHLVSTYPAAPEIELASLHILPVAFSQATGTAKPPADKTAPARRSWIKRLSSAGMRTRFRQWFGPLTIPAAAEQLKAIIAEIQPDLVHAMRIPYEGMLAAQADPAAPLLISIWGNDFTLHGNTTPIMRRFTRQAVRRADALLADCQRDIRLAHEWGYAQSGPTRVLPGGGGLQLDWFYPSKEQTDDGPMTVINPRGMRAYVRNDVFFQAIPLVLAAHPQTQFLGVTMQGEPQAEKWAYDLGIQTNVLLMPIQSRAEMAALFRRSQVAVSPSEHDGTPNTLLEAMACGCFPVAGDIESVREWIEHGHNGLLVNPADPQALAAAIITGLEDAPLRAQAAAHNTKLIAERAEHGTVMQAALAYYQEIVGQ